MVLDEVVHDRARVFGEKKFFCSQNWGNRPKIKSFLIEFKEKFGH